MYRLKLISPRFGIDESGPLHPTLQHAQRAAQTLLLVYGGEIKVEIRKVLDLHLRRSELVETLRQDGSEPVQGQ